MAKRRHLSRIAVMQSVFELQARGWNTSTGEDRDYLAMLEKNIAEQGGQEGVDRAFCDSLLLGTIERWEEIIHALETYAPQWPLNRMDPVSRATLMVGAYELLFANDAPPAVVMDEAIEIAKEFGTSESGKFVNGVLNAVAKGKKAGSG